MIWINDETEKDSMWKAWNKFTGIQRQDDQVNGAMWVIGTITTLVKTNDRTVVPLVREAIVYCVN